MPANQRWSTRFRGGRGGNQNRFGSNHGFQDIIGLGHGNSGRDLSSSNIRFGGRGAVGYSSQGYGHTDIIHSQGRNMSALNSANPLVNPWATGVIPPGGGGSGNFGGGFMPPPGGSGSSLLGEYRGGGTADLVGSIRHLSQMDNPESKLALNILNTVLSTRSSVGQNQSGWNNGPPANKMMRMDMGGGYDNYRGQTLAPSMHQPARKFPQRDHQFGPRRAGDNLSPRRGRGGRFLGQAGRQVTTEQQSRKTVNDKKGMTKDSKGLVKDQKKEKDEESAAAATGTTGGQKGDKTEGDDSSATADPKQSGEVIKEDSKEGKENGASCEEEVKKEEAQSVESTAKKDPPKRLRSDGLIPKETLKCHMCNFYQFNSLQGFKNHLESRNHEQMSRAFHAKGVAVLNLLKAQARLAAQRNILKQRRMGMKGRISNCSRCDCSYMGSSADHSKLREHYLITTFAKCSPCRIWFKNRADLEIHRLSDIHLMRQMVIDKKRLDKASNVINIEEDLMPEHESMKKVHDAVSKLKATHSMRNVWTAHRLPFYDPAVPIGLNFVIKKSNYYCKICQNKTMQSAKEAQAHFCSREHYDNYATYLKNLEDTKELEKTKQEENGDAHENIVNNEEDENQQENNTIPQDKENQREDADEDVSNVDTNDVEMLDKECDKANVDSSSGPTKKTQKNGDEYYGDIIDRLENEDLDMMDDESDEEEQVITDKTTTKSGDTKAQKNATKCDSDISSKSDKSAVSAMEEVLSDTDDTKKNSKSSSDIKKDDGGRSDMDNTGKSVDKASAVGVADDEGKKSEDECEAAPAVSASPRRGRGKGRGRGRATRK